MLHLSFLSLARFTATKRTRGKWEHVCRDDRDSLPCLEATSSLSCFPFSFGNLSKRRGLLSFVFFALWIASEAQAHSIKLFATVEGKKIRGYAYTPGGGRITRGTVEIWTGGEEPEARVELDAKGEFFYEPKRCCDHRFVLKLPDGHRAEYTVRTSELSFLSASETTVNVTASPPSRTSSSPPSDATRAIFSSPSSSLESELRQLQAEILALRRQIDEAQTHRSWQDIFGGVGYLVGLAGLAGYFASRRRSSQA